MFNSNRAISTPITILIIILVAATIGGTVWVYKKNQPPIEETQEETTNFSFIKTGSGESLDQQKLQELQDAVDNGHQPWRLDPLFIAKTESSKYGFKDTDEFTLVSKELAEYAGTYIAEVEAIHDNEKYIIQLIQPVKIGDEGIWVVNSIREAE